MRKVFIIGASSGIGYATAKKFVESGDFVINMSRTPCGLVGVTNILCDVTSEHYDSKLNEVVNSLDKLDIFVYSAGFSMASPLEHVKESDYRYLFEVNYFGFVKAMQVLIPMLRASGGVACVVSSTAGMLPIAYDSYYCSSKAAVNMLINSLSLELMSRGVKVISIMPGGTKTKFTYKRKVYDNKDIGDYSLQQSRAVKNLAKIEQTGESPQAVASTIYKECAKPRVAHTFASGLSNKFFVLCSKIFPQSVLHFISSKIYFR